VRSIDTKDQSSSVLASYASSKSKNKILPKYIKRGWVNGKNQLEKLDQIEKSRKQDLLLHPKLEKDHS
jgi:helix-turn-helix protein